MSTTKNIGAERGTEIFLLAIAMAKCVKCCRDLVTLVQTLQRLQTTTNSVIVVLRFYAFHFLLLQGAVNLLYMY